MYKKLLLASAFSFALATSSFAEEAKAPVNSVAGSVGVVNVQLIMNSLPQAKAHAEALQKEFGPRSDELKKIEEQGKKFQEALKTQEGEKAIETQRKLQQLQSEFELKGRAFQEDVQKKEREIEMELQRIMQKAIDLVAKERGLQLVIRGEAIVFASDAVNISDEVIARASKIKLAKKEDKK